MAFVNARDCRRRNEGMSGLNDAPTPPGCLSSPAVPFVCTRNRTCVQVHAARCVVLDKYFSLRYCRSHFYFVFFFHSRHNKSFLLTRSIIEACWFFQIQLLKLIDSSKSFFRIANYINDRFH